MALTGKQRRRLRALGHHLQVVVQVGGKGVTKGVIAATAQALEDHELVKVKIDAERDERAEALQTLAQKTGAEIAQTLGKTALLFKQHKKKPKIKLDGPAPKPKAASALDDGDDELVADDDELEEADDDDGDDDAEGDDPFASDEGED